MPSHDILLRSKLKLGKELIAAKRFTEARGVYQQICARKKNDADHWLTLGAINGLLQRHDEAVDCCTKAVELAPQHSVAWYNLGIALRDTGQTEKAADALRKTLSLNPKQENAATSLGHILIALQRYQEAEEVFRRMLEYEPDSAEFYAVFGSAMQTLGRYDAAMNAYRQAIARRHPRAADIHENMARTLCLQGKHRESIEAFDAALAIDPQNTRVYSDMLLTLHYLTERQPQNFLDRHRRWPGNATLAVTKPLQVNSERRPERLRIGYVSSDLRKHSVAYFIESLLANHDAKRYEITCYFSHQDADALTRRMQQLAHRWRNVAELDDQQLKRVIADDKIDILVDLNGHTSGNRLPVFAARAAPLQVTFIGYPDTTGVTQMDYRLSDAIADPPGAEVFCTESLIRLSDCFLCYRPPDDAPRVACPPFEKNGFITFGSFNNLAKINEEVAALWASLLRDMSDSRLVIKNPLLSGKFPRERCQALFAACGIDSERLELMAYVTDDASHLGAYDRIDVALDTFPYNGATTTCEALWMGVPVVSLAGDHHCARVGASLLTAAGLPELIATTSQHYMQICRELVEDRAGLAKLRAQLREQVRHSSLCSAATYAREIENAYEEMYSKLAQDCPTGRPKRG